MWRGKGKIHTAARYAFEIVCHAFVIHLALLKIDQDQYESTLALGEKRHGLADHRAV